MDKLDLDCGGIKRNRTSHICHVGLEDRRRDISKCDNAEDHIASCNADTVMKLEVAPQMPDLGGSPVDTG